MVAPRPARRPDIRASALAPGGLRRAHHPRRRRPDRAAAPARAALYPATVRQIVTADIRIIKHELLRSKCGSFEVQFSDDRPPDISIGTTSRAAGCGRTCSPASRRWSRPRHSHGRSGIKASRKHLSCWPVLLLDQGKGPAASGVQPGAGSVLVGGLGFPHFLFCLHPEFQIPAGRAATGFPEFSCARPDRFF